MYFMKRIIYSISCLLLVVPCAAQTSAKQKAYDVCVYGESAAGVMAAVQSGRMGKKVVLISKNNHVGGMATSGLTATDMSGPTLLGGIAKEFYQRIYTYYLDPKVWKNQDRESYMKSTEHDSWKGKNDNLKMQWVYENHVGEMVLKKMLKEANVEIMFNKPLDLQKRIIKKGAKITGIPLTNGSMIHAKVFIDASYEGDLLARAGVSYTYGREGNKKYGETLNGIRYDSGQKIYPVDPYIKEGDPASGLLPFVEKKLWGKDGDADRRSQAYCYRLSLTNDPNNRRPLEKPKNYHPLWYEFTARRIKANSQIPLNKVITISPMPNKKTDTNHMDLIGGSYEYAEADHKKRKAIENMHRDYALGLLWFLANDPRLPEHIRNDMNTWGLAKDEFIDNRNFPYQIYVREGRRMIGEFVMTQKNVQRNDRVDADHAIGYGSYSLDCHEVSRVATEDNKVRTDGDIYISTKPYPISYYSIVPDRKECNNLLVPVCLSASHVAYTTIRMEPVYVVLGQAAGMAACLAIDKNYTVQELPYEELKASLLKNGQVISVNR